MIKNFVVRLLFFTLLWLTLTGGDTRQPILALMIVLGATYSSMLLWSKKPLKLRPYGMLKFIPFFFIRSLQGGIDVAIRAFKPGLPLNPGLIEFKTSIKEPGPRFFLSLTFSLLPGTAIINRDEERILVHVLDTELDTASRLAELEEHIRKMYYCHF